MFRSQQSHDVAHVTARIGAGIAASRILLTPKFQSALPMSPAVTVTAMVSDCAAHVTHPITVSSSAGSSQYVAQAMVRGAALRKVAAAPVSRPPSIRTDLATARAIGALSLIRIRSPIGAMESDSPRRETSFLAASKVRVCLRPVRISTGLGRRLHASYKTTSNAGLDGLAVKMRTDP